VIYIIFLSLTTGIKTLIADDTKLWTKPKEEKVEIPLYQQKLNKNLWTVCACESNDCKYPKHYNDKGGVLIGVTGDVGLCQINPYVHTESSRKLGMDIYTEEGNIAYANYLFSKNGYRDWRSSAHAHGKY
jgi:hypothetical protein